MDPAAGKKGKGGDPLDALKHEQREIERRMRELEIREAELEKQESLRRAKAEHERSMREYKRMMDEQEAQAGLLANPPAIPSQEDAAARDAALNARIVNAENELKKYRDAYKTKREAAIQPKPFSFVERAPTRGGDGPQALTIRARRHMEEEMERQRKEDAEVCYPNGAYEFRAGTVPPGTFVNKLDIMAIEGEERRRQRKEKAREAWSKQQPEPSIVDAPRYVSEPLTRREKYVPVAEQMTSYKFKPKPVPRSVKQPKWDKIVEAEILRKMDVKEAARYRLAEFEREFPKAARVESPQRTAERRSQSAGRHRSRSVPGLPEECRFKPDINREVPDFSKYRAQEVLKQYKKQPAQTTTPRGFKLSSTRAKPTAEVQHDIAKDNATLPEDRWPYVGSRLPPQRRSPSRSKSVPPVRYTKAANMLLLEKSMAIVRREEEKKKATEEAREREKRRQLVAATLKRYGDGVDWKGKGKKDGAADDEDGPVEHGWMTTTRNWKAKKAAMQDNIRKQKPIWLRAPEGQAEDAAIRARVEEVAAQPGGGGGGGDAGSNDDDDGAGTPVAAAAAAAKPAAKAKAKTKGSDSDSDSSSSSSSAKKDDDNDDSDSYSD